jgi:heat shock protein HtpX
MFIVNPLNGERMDNLFATHPNVESRIRELEEIAAEMRGEEIATMRPSPIPQAGRRPGMLDPR